MRTMMTLEEAIIHAEEVLDRCEVTDGDRACAEEHRQLAEWLKELAERRKQPEIIFCKDCKHKGTRNCVANALTIAFHTEVKDDFYCGLAERRTDD